MCLHNSWSFEARYEHFVFHCIAFLVYIFNVRNRKITKENQGSTVIGIILFLWTMKNEIWPSVSLTEKKKLLKFITVAIRYWKLESNPIWGCTINLGFFRLLRSLKNKNRSYSFGCNQPGRKLRRAFQNSALIRQRRYFCQEIILFKHTRSLYYNVFN